MELQTSWLSDKDSWCSSDQQTQRTSPCLPRREQNRPWFCGMPPTTSAAQESEPLHPDTMRQAQLLAPSVSTFDPVGILAIEVYFPRKYVDQRALESFDGVTPGKYTIGLGQQAMSFCGDREDVRSMCMTVVQTLMEKYRIEYNDIGRLEVGTETIIDRAKSIKTALMSLFEQSGNFEVEGIDSTNACYAGTNALFNTIAWCESCTLFDGRFGLVVCGDIAVYPRGPARATGGAGAVALLIGRAQPQRYPQLEPILVLEQGLKSSHFENTWDFFKPARRQDTEYPIVNGTESIACYFRALDICYTRFTGRVEQQTRRTRVWLAETSGRPGAEQVTEQQSLRCTLLTSTAFAEPSVTPVADADATQLDYVVFHAPFNKLVRKSFARLVLNDYLRYPELASQHRAVSGALRAQLAKLKRLPAHLNPTGVCVPPPSTYWDRTLMQLVLECSEPLYRAKCAPSTTLARQTGNAYTASLFGNLLCLLDAERDRTLGKRVVLFGFGSGMAASMYAMRVVASPEPLLRRVGLIERLGARIPTSPACFHETLRLREQNYGACDYEPSEPLEELFPGTYYLVRIDGHGIRYYDRYQGSRASDQAACCNALCPDKP